MREYIDFEVARKYLHEACAGLGSNGGLMLKIKFDQEPKADVFEVVREVVRGEWKECEIVQEHGDEPIIDEWQSARCSVCGKYHTTPYMYFFDHFNYCPNCGAKMERREDAN